MTQMAKTMRSHFLGLFLLSLLTGCASYQQKECSIFIAVEAQHAKDLDALVTANVKQALGSASYKKHWNGMWVSELDGSMVRLKKEKENPFVVNVHFWDEPGSYASCNIRSSSIKKHLEEHFLSNHVPATVREAIPVD